MLRASTVFGQTRTGGVRDDEVRYGIRGGARGGTGGGAASAKTQLTVYTALENEQLRPYKAAFEAANPDVEIVWVRDSTGVITARLLAEKANPKADVIMGVAVTSLILFENEGMIEPYAVRGADQLRPAFRDAKNPPAWIGMDAYMSAVCYNTVEGQKKNIPQPTSWADLLKPEYRGQIVMPNPASSGTGFLSVSGWLQSMGEAPGWKYMDGLHQNVAVYTHSGSAPCVQAARGEYVVGISFEYRAAQERPRARRSRSSCRPRAWAGTWRRRPSTRAPRTSKLPRS